MTGRVAHGWPFIFLFSGIVRQPRRAGSNGMPTVVRYERIGAVVQ